MSDLERQAEHYRKQILEGKIEEHQVNLQRPKRSGCFDHVVFADPDNCNNCRSRAQIGTDDRDYGRAQAVIDKALHERKQIVAEGKAARANARAPRERADVSTNVGGSTGGVGSTFEGLGTMLMLGAGVVLLAILILVYQAVSGFIDAAKIPILVALLPVLFLSTFPKLNTWVQVLRSVAIALAAVALCYQIGFITHSTDDIGGTLASLLKTLLVTSVLGAILWFYNPDFGQRHNQRGLLARWLDSRSESEGDAESGVSS